ncbi:MAG TPA: hypothetical protein VF676_03105 [Flavobacterium sp.]
MKIVTTIILFFSICGIAQTTSNDKLLAAENLTWLDNFRNLTDIAIKLDSTKLKIRRDIVYAVNERACFYFIPNPNYQKMQHKTYECKIPFILAVGNRYYNLDPIENIHAEKIIGFLLPDHIESFEILNNQMAFAFAGSGASCGGILIHSKHKELRNYLKSNVP